MESLADPGAFVFPGRQITALQDVIGIHIPLAAGIVGAQHRSGGLRLAVQAQRIISLGQPLQRFGDLGRGLIVLHHHPEAVDAADIVAAGEV